MKFEFNWPSVSVEKLFEKMLTDGRTAVGVTGTCILVAHPGELKYIQTEEVKFKVYNCDMNRHNMCDIHRFHTLCVYCDAEW